MKPFSSPSPLGLTLLTRGFVLIFFTLLCAPLIRFLSVKVDEVDLHEHRRLADFPKPTSLAELPTQLNSYVNDHFGFRNELITLHRMIDSNIFHISTSTSVLPGKSGWLFFIGDEGLEDLQHASPLTAAQTTAIHDVLKQRSAALDQAGIPYLFVAVPDKQTVYPEQIPPGIVNPSGSTRLQTVQHDLESDPLVASHFLSLAPAFLAAKHSDPGHDLYFKTDTHWNLYGGAIGYQAMMEKLNERLATFPSNKLNRIKPLQLPMESFESQPSTYGDLNYMAELKLPDRTVHSRLVEENSSTLIFSKFPVSAKWQDHFDQQEGWKNPYSIYNSSAPNKKTLLLLGDSFGERLQFYLSDTFEHVVIVSNRPENGFLVDMVQRTHPDFVIEERVERYFSHPYLDSFTNSQNSPFNPSAVPPESNTVPINLNALADGRWQVVSGKSGNENLFQPETSSLIPIVRNEVKGAVEQIFLPHEAADSLIVQGWAIDPQSNRPFDAVMAVLGSHVIALSPSDLDRPDTSTNLHVATLRDGYRFTIPFNLLRYAGRLRVFGIHGGQKLSDYQLQELPYGPSVLTSPIPTGKYDLIRQGQEVELVDHH